VPDTLAAPWTCPTGLVFSTPLQSHLCDQPWSSLAQSLVAGRFAALRTTAESFAPRFDAAVALSPHALYDLARSIATTHATPAAAARCLSVCPLTAEPA